MIVTARQLQDLHRQNGGDGSITLPYRARLTPLAQDWVRARKIALGFSDVAPGSFGQTPTLPSPGTPGEGNGGGSTGAAGARTTGRVTSCRSRGNSGEGRVGVGAGTARTPESRPTPGTLPILWWCDGPCGPAKAAIVHAERESNLRALDMPSEAGQLARVIRTIAAQVKSRQSAGAVLLVQNAAMATVFANRCPSLRAVPGTCLQAVEQGVRQVAANVLIIEYPYKTLQQMRNLLSRFVRGGGELSADVRRQLEELASCG